MPTKNRVIWREGTFVRPQHFQQQQRHLDYLFSNQLLALNKYNYGLLSLEIDQDLLKLGRVSILSANGIFPDGTYFDIPAQDMLPNTLEISDVLGTDGRDIYLGLPTITTSINEIQSDYNKSNHLVRYAEVTENVRDIHTPDGDSTHLFLAQLTPKLMLGSDDRSSYTSLPIARIKERLQDGRLVLDDKFIPTSLDVVASKELRNFVSELSNTLEQRAETLSSRIGAPGQQGVSDAIEFLMLELLNRTLPLYRHLDTHPHFHPEIFYRELVQFCGELMTFTDASRLAREFMPYDHLNQTQCFQNLFKEIRIALSTVLTPKAVSIQLEQNEYGIRSASINDQDLLVKAEFILAVSARIPEELLRRQFIHQTKVTSLNRIQKLVGIQLPGVELYPLTVAPRQLPYHAGYTYFRLDTNGDEWKEVQASRGIAFHVSGDFPELDMQLWAIRG